MSRFISQITFLLLRHRLARNGCHSETTKKRHSTTMLRWMKVNAFLCHVNLIAMCIFPYFTRPERWDFICSRRMLSQCSKPILFVVEKQKQHVWRISSSESFTTFHFFAWSATAVSAEEATMHRSNKGKKIRLATTNVKTRFHVHNRLGNLSFPPSLVRLHNRRLTRKISFCHPTVHILKRQTDSIM